MGVMPYFTHKNAVFSYGLCAALVEDPMVEKWLRREPYAEGIT